MAKPRNHNAWLAGLVIGLCDCQRTHPANESQLMPKLAPPPGPAVRSDLRIEVREADRLLTAIDAQKLEQRTPDFVDSDHRAWKFSTLLGPRADLPGSEIRVTGQGGLTMALPIGPSAGAPVPVLMLTRRGDVIGALVRTDDPFPAFHGQGRRMQRAGDPLPHITGVTAIELAHRAGGREGVEFQPLLVNLRGRPVSHWTSEKLAEVPTFEVHGERDAARSAWSLRDLVRRFYGPKAWIDAINAEGGRRVSLARAEWLDPKRIPILRPNREGQLKFQWVDPTGATEEGSDLRSVVGLSIEPE